MSGIEWSTVVATALGGVISAGTSWVQGRSARRLEETKEHNAEAKSRRQAEEASRERVAAAQRAAHEAANAEVLTTLNEINVLLAEMDATAGKIVNSRLDVKVSYLEEAARQFGEWNALQTRIQMLVESDVGEIMDILESGLKKMHETLAPIDMYYERERFRAKMRELAEGSRRPWTPPAEPEQN